MQGNDDGTQEEEIETKFVEEGLYPIVDTDMELMMEEVAPSLTKERQQDLEAVMRDSQWYFKQNQVVPH